MPKTLTLSICQFPIQFLDWEKNSQKSAAFIQQAAACDSDLIIFPEMSLTGISDHVLSMADSTYKNLKFFSNLAKKHHIAIGFGWGKPAKTKLENHYTVVDAKGELLSDYVKIHPFTFANEHLRFVSGHGFSTFSYAGFTFASFLCYDMRFPELFQAASKSCDFILVAANWPQSRSLHWKILSQARAIENQVYLAACNCVGDINGIFYSGDSALYHPNGTKLGSLSQIDGLITCTITNDVASIRKGFPVKKDRLTDYYKSIL